MNIERIDKVISRSGNLSRNDVKKLVRAGAVKLNGLAVSSSSEKMDTLRDCLEINGEPFLFEEFVYIMLNKPLGIVSSSERDGERTVIDILPDSLRRNGLFPAGRLDKDTSGFVLITDDGEFAHNILSPKKHIPKTYIATVSRELSKDEEQMVRNGLKLKNDEFLPAEIKLLPSDDRLIIYELILREGKYHQIKRMFARFSNPVLSLHRTKMGALPLDKALASGECRKLTAEEVAMLSDNSD